ncbi:peptidyl-tRNA hydrolase ptrhd1-like protein [Trifolium pratense]|uniref:peptidyl-tRNA hydrolase n=1 Tax=Trifolium pratense TaxID=57577 RepID=A0A2K3PK51_TRIPR|nr:peptidyl-tRNA hydrolase ptrhd1-like protein [Trifolium pratense]
MAYTIPSLRLFKPSGSNFPFSTTKFTVTLHAASFSNRTSRLASNSMSQPAATDSSTISTPNDVPSPSENADVVVQYVVLRRDLIDTWPLGSVITQGCHASVSAVWSNKDDPITIDYCSPDKIDSMHKTSGISMSDVIEVPTSVAVEQEHIALGQRPIGPSLTPKWVVLDAELGLGLVHNRNHDGCSFLYIRQTRSACCPLLIKVTLEVKGEPQIKNLSEKLTSGGIIHKLWIEQPENIPTCLATKPYPKSIVSSYFKKLKLCK